MNDTTYWITTVSLFIFAAVTELAMVRYAFYGMMTYGFIVSLPYLWDMCKRLGTLAGCMRGKHTMGALQPPQNIRYCDYCKYHELLGNDGTYWIAFQPGWKVGKEIPR